MAKKSDLSEEEIHAMVASAVKKALAESEAPLLRFLRLLKAAGLTEPNPKVIAMVRKSAMYSVLLNSVGTPGEARAFYSEMSELPRTETRAAVLATQGVAIGDPFPGATDISRSHIFTAFRNERPCVLKLPNKLQDLEREVKAVAALGVLPADCPLVPIETILLERDSDNRLTDAKDSKLADVIGVRRGFLMPQLAATCADRSRASPVPADRARTHGERILSALDFLHSKGFAHCDVKPSNMLLDCEGRAFLSDFGSVHQLGERLYGAGTPHYQPEDACEYATKELDRACLVASLLEMHGRRLPTSGLTLAWLREEALRTDQPLQAFLTAVLEQKDADR